MSRYFFLIVIFLSALLSAEDITVPRLSSEQDTMSLVQGVVNAQNGKLVQIDQDIDIKGSGSLDLVRYYDGGHHFDGSYGYGVGLSFPLEIKISDPIPWNLRHLYLEQREGSTLLFEVSDKNDRYLEKCRLNI